MKNIWLITRREFLSRVMKRSFILTTLLTPLAILAFIVISGFIFSYDSDEKLEVVILDEAGILGSEFENTKNINFEFVDRSISALKVEYLEEKFDGILHLMPLTDLTQEKFNVLYYSDKSLPLEASTTISSKIRNGIRDYKIIQYGIDKSQLASLKTKVLIDPEPISDDIENDSSMATVVGSVLGGAMGYLMFMVILIYGMMVMRSVMEEKINRIVEIMISSVKPFELMMGKILGVGAVGLTQIIIWSILIPVIFFIGNLITGGAPSPEITDMVSQQNMNVPEELPLDLSVITAELANQNWFLILPMFLIYFLGGYIIYTSLFAAVGSAIGDDLNEGNSLTMPLMLPIILATYIMIKVVSVPNSNLAIWSSIFPLFSPIVMPARLSAEIPIWQIIASIASLILFAALSVWVAGRIYRTGILLYGKKMGFKEIFKLMRR